MDERQVTIIMLLAQVCALYDPTPFTFIRNVIRFQQLGIIESISFLNDLGLIHSTMDLPLSSTYYSNSNSNSVFNNNNSNSINNINNINNINSKNSINTSLSQNKMEISHISNNINNNNNNNNDNNDTYSVSLYHKLMKKNDINDKVVINPIKNKIHDESSLILETSQRNELNQNYLDIFSFISRYDRDFEEIKIIGTGAFGVVYMSKNKLDDNYYAIKKITFTNHNNKNPYLKKVLREVRCLAKCDHPNVNRYYTAWLEPTWFPLLSNTNNNNDINHKKQSNDRIPKNYSLHQLNKQLNSYSSNDNIFHNISPKVSLQNKTNEYHGMNNDTRLLRDIHQMVITSNNHENNNSNLNNSLIDRLKNDSFPVFEEIISDNSSMKEDMNSSNGTHKVDVFFHDSSDNHIKELEQDNISQTKDLQTIEVKSDSRLKTKLKKQQQFSYHITLYIQMYLCEQSTLRDWLDIRNRACLNNQENKTKYNLSNHAIEKLICVETNLRLFRQLVEGLHHVHKQGIIHRDLKPSNVFIGKNGNLKIGDFGLSKLIEKAQELSTDENSSNIDSNIDNDAEIKTKKKKIILSTSDEVIDNHVNVHLKYDNTSGVGTVAYASPEQISGTIYDEKVDSYSLGVILLELFSIFPTIMERAKALEKLRHTPPVIDKNLSEKYPEISTLIIHLVEKDKEKRYNTRQILDYLDKNFPQVQLRQAKEVLALRQKLETQEKTIADQEAMINDLKRQLANSR